MKKIFRFFSLGIVTTVVAAGAAFAQDPCADADGQTALYTKFTDSYSKTAIPDREATIETGKQFLEKYGACEAVKEQVDYMKGAIPKLEEQLVKIKAAAEERKLFGRFDAGINSDNPDEVYAAGKEILAKYPGNLNIIVPMAVIGMYQSNPANNFKYSDSALQYGNDALSKLQSGAQLTKKNKAGEETVGALKFEYTRQNAIDELTYGIANLTYFAKKDKKTALPLLYTLSQSAGSYKTDPRIYGMIGDYYIEQGGPIGEQIAAKIEEQKKPDEAVDIKEAREKEIKGLVALFNGYTERALDAYSRAYKAAKDDTPARKAYKDNLYKIMQGLYKRRFEKDTGLDAFVATMVAKPFPNPTSEVQPVADPDPVTTTTTTGAAVVTKPVSDATPKTAASDQAAVVTPSPVAAAKAPAKKPAAKKRGTR